MGQENKKPDNPSSAMSLGEHLEELRWRLILSIAGVIIAMIACLFFGSVIISFIEKPYIEVMGEDARLQTLSPAEGFVCYMNISLVAGLVVASPWVFYQLWMFIAAGLYPKEKKYVYVALPVSVTLFVVGALLFIFYIAPVTLKFLVMFNREFLTVSSSFTFKNYISFMSLMMLAFGLAFQTPIVVFVLTGTGLVPIDVFRKFRKYVILGIVVIAAAVIPGSDPISLFALSIPMYLLYELGIFFGAMSFKKKKSRMDQ
jgi:Tat protein translocase TatC